MCVHRLHGVRGLGSQEVGGQRHLCSPRQAVLPGDCPRLGMPSSPHKGALCISSSCAEVVSCPGDGHHLRTPQGKAVTVPEKIHSLCESSGLLQCFAGWTPSYSNGEHTCETGRRLPPGSGAAGLVSRAAPSGVSFRARTRGGDVTLRTQAVSPFSSR